MAVKSGAAPLQLSTCEYLNISVCPSTSAVDAVSYIPDVVYVCYYGNIV